MDVKTREKRDPALVVRYRPAARAHLLPSRYLSLFLSTERQLKIRLAELDFSDRDFAIFVMSRVVAGLSSTIPELQLIISSDWTKPIHDVEMALDKPGQIAKLILEAKTSPHHHAKSEDISVVIGDASYLDPFEDIGIPETVRAEEPMNGMDFYESTEVAQALLNDTIAGYSRLAFHERKKEQPNQALLLELETNKKLAYKLLKNPQTFQSFYSLHEVIEDYSPIVRSLFEDRSSSSLAAS